MLPYDTHRTLAVFPSFFIGSVKFGPYSIPSYLLMFWLGVAAVVLLGLREARRKRLPARDLLIYYAAALVLGAFFARLFYALFFAADENKLAFFLDFFRAGLASSGAWFGVLCACVGFYLYRKKRFWQFLDAASVGALLGQAIGRVGCFLAGCCYGRKVSEGLWWAVYYKDAVRHPAQLYDMANALLGFALVWYVKDKRLFPGATVLVTFMAYSFGRVIVEFFRLGPRIGPFTASQVFYSLIFVASGVVFLKKFRAS